MTETTGDKLRRNARASMFTWIWGQGLNFVRMMVIIAFLDTDGYGLWVFAFSIISYFVFYNFGIANALIKYTADYHARQDYKGLGELLSTALAITTSMGALVAVILWTFSEQAVGFFNMEEAHAADARFVVLGIGVITAFTMALDVYPAILVGIQRLDVKNYCRVGVMTIEFAVAVVLLTQGYGIRMLVVVYGAGVVLSTIIMAGFVRHYLPELRLNLFRPRWIRFKELLALGGAMQALGTVSILVAQLDIILFMRFGGPAFVGAYGAAQRFAQRAQGPALQAFGALAPASADLIARKEFEKLAEVYAAAMRLCAIGGAFLFGYIALHADFVMHFVMGAKYDELSTFALTWLCLGYFIHTLTGPGSSMLRGAGKPLREILYQLLTAAVFCALYFFLATPGNDHAMIAAWPAALGIASAAFIVLANRYFHVNAATPCRQTFLLLLAAPGFAALIRAAWDFLAPFDTESRWTALAAIALTGAVYAPLFAAAAFLAPGLTPNDRLQLLRVMPGGLRLAEKWRAFRGTGP